MRSARSIGIERGLVGPMIPFVSGYVLVFAGVCATALLAEQTPVGRNLLGYEPLDWREVLVQLLVLPVVTAALGLEALERARPRRWLDVRVRRIGSLLLAGVGSAAIAVIVLTVALVWLEDYAPAWVLLPGCVTLSTGSAFALMPGVRPGRCVQCGYDVSDRSGGGRCPECGTLDP